LVINKNRTEMHGQQNIKRGVFVAPSESRTPIQYAFP